MTRLRVGVLVHWSARSLATACLVLGLPVVAAAQSVVVQWNEAALQAVRVTQMAPVQVARSLAILHTCIFDAWAAYDPVAVGTSGAWLRQPASQHTDAARRAAISMAAYRALVDLFPSQREALFAPLLQSLGGDPANHTDDLTTPDGIGNRAAAAVLAVRHGDGANQLGDLAPGAYADYTGYESVNSPDQLIDAGRWQPLRMASGAAQPFLAPHWGRVTPFAFAPDASTVAAPVPYGGAAYLSQADALVRLSAGLTDVDKCITSYWADGPATETPPGHWNVFAQVVSARDGLSLDQDVQLFFALGNALLDASIAAWDAKRAYDYVRPISAVRSLYEGRRLRAWAGPGLGTQDIAGETFRPYLDTPPHADHVSGHSTFSAAAAGILRRFTGSDWFGASVTITAGTSPVEWGAVPAKSVVLEWATFTDAADEAGYSRRLGGIHFEGADLAGRELGERVASVVWVRAERLRRGGDEPR